ncbi:MAG: amidase, partial [Pseudomonadales bacterium]
RVSRYGAWPLAQSLDHIGPMARSVADAARVLQVIAGPDANDPSAVAGPVPNLVALAADDGALEDLQGVRIGVDADYSSLGVDAGVVDSCLQASALLQARGATIVPVHMPSAARALVAHWSETCGVETAAVHSAYYPSQRERYGPALSSLIEIGRATSAARYQELEQLRAQFRTQLEALFAAADVLLMPGLPRPVPRTEVAEGRVEESAPSADYLTFTAPFNYSGHPTLSLPAGLETQSSGGSVALPRALQLVGPLLGEQKLVVVGLALEAALNDHFGSLYVGEHVPPL